MEEAGAHDGVTIMDAARRRDTTSVRSWPGYRIPDVASVSLVARPEAHHPRPGGGVCPSCRTRGPGHADAPPTDGAEGVRRFRQDHGPGRVLPQAAPGRRGRRLGVVGRARRARRARHLHRRGLPKRRPGSPGRIGPRGNRRRTGASNRGGGARDPGFGQAVRDCLRRVGTAGESRLVVAAGVPARARPVQSAPGDRVSANPGRIERGGRRAGWPSPACDDRGTEVFNVPCGRVLQPEVVARRAGSRDETFPGMAVRVAHCPQPDVARRREGRRCRSGHRRETEENRSVRAGLEYCTATTRRSPNRSISIP